MVRACSYKIGYLKLFLSRYTGLTLYTASIRSKAVDFAPSRVPPVRLWRKTPSFILNIHSYKVPILCEHALVA